MILPEQTVDHSLGELKQLSLPLGNIHSLPLPVRQWSCVLSASGVLKVPFMHWYSGHLAPLATKNGRCHFRSSVPSLPPSLPPSPDPINVPEAAWRPRGRQFACSKTTTQDLKDVVLAASVDRRWMPLASSTNCAVPVMLLWSQKSSKAIDRARPVAGRTRLC